MYFVNGVIINSTQCKICSNQ